MLGIVATVAAALLAGAAPARQSAARPDAVEVVVVLHAAPLARAAANSRAFRARAFEHGKLDPASPASLNYLRRLKAQQAGVAARIVRAIPSARVRWHYRLLLNGMAVVVPPNAVSKLARIPGVTEVYPSVAYRPSVERNITLIGAPDVWGPLLDTAGQGMKIGIIDDGVDQRHPFFSPTGFTMPPGFPKGQANFTTAKVIAARAFAPPGSTYAPAKLPFDNAESEHATHVAGIAAGNAHTTAVNVPGRGTVPEMSGVAPAAYIGNYKVLGTPTPEVGLDGNSAEIVAGIEAAVADGMDVINLSLGEPEIEPTRDIVTKAIDAAATAGVIPAIAAGNDRTEFGDGTVGSPGSAAKAITAAAVDVGGRLAGFSSSGPTPVSLRMKPDVSAPGASILSSIPASKGTWTQFSGTSMASPHVAGAAAVLRQRHPTWTVAQIKSALVQTGNPARAGGSAEAPTTLEGGGVIFLPRADNPLLFATPTGLSFGLRKAGSTATQTVNLADAGGGAGQWTAAVQQQRSTAAVKFTVPATVTVPGSFAVKVTVGAAPELDLTGFVVLTNGTERRRIPYWLRTEKPRLPLSAHGVLTKAGTYNGSTLGRPAWVSTYRYPDNPSGAGITRVLKGPEQVFRVTLKKPVANFGVALLTRSAATVHVEPRVVANDDENQLTGYAALPMNINPYSQNFQALQAVAGAIRPKAGKYSVVFDSATKAGAGRFTFRFWVDDTTPPAIGLLTRTIASGGTIRLAITDKGSSVDPFSLAATIDGVAVRIAFDSGRATIKTGSLSAGNHKLVVRASDYQETKNMENVAQILPNTRTVTTSFAVK